jgi:ribulose-phosphate 3-epimerase
MKIEPSLISSDLLNLQHTLSTFDRVCDGYHLDVMDGHFVPNLTWGPMFINAIGKATKLPLCIHLMVDNPARWLGDLVVRPQDTVVFHTEVVTDVAFQKALVERIAAMGCHAGIALNPATTVDAVIPLLPIVDMILIMSVEPGFSGQKFIPEVTKKIEPLCKLRSQLHKTWIIGMDGGINHANIVPLVGLGVDSVAVASAIFDQPDPLVAIEQLRHATRPA